MSWAATLSLACLVVTCSICTWGIFSQHFDDTLVQRVGLSVVATGTGARIMERLTQEVPDAPPALLWSQVGLALYAIGTVWRFWRQARRQPDRRVPRHRRGLML